MRDDETSVRTVHAERRRLSAIFEELTPELSRSRFRRWDPHADQRYCSMRAA
jgi:hypothetical protein